MTLISWRWFLYAVSLSTIIPLRASPTVRREMAVSIHDELEVSFYAELENVKRIKSAQRISSCSNPVRNHCPGSCPMDHDTIDIVLRNDVGNHTEIDECIEILQIAWSNSTLCKRQTDSAPLRSFPRPQTQSLGMSQHLENSRSPAHHLGKGSTWNAMD